MWNWVKDNISKKLTAVFIAVAAPLIAKKFGIEPLVVEQLLWVVAAYLLGQSLVDFRVAGK